MQTQRAVFAYQGSYSHTATGDALAGLSLGVKDLFHMAGIPTAAGNPDWLATHDIPQVTSPVVSRLLDAGAQFAGKTQTDEIAYSLNGTNVHYGTPTNPRAPKRIPGGSSSGSAVAVAAGLVDIGLGTDTGGSIRVPSSYNGLFGLRPTHGLLSLQHAVPLAPMFDTVGWMTRDLSTLSRVAKVLLPEQIATEIQQVAVLSPVMHGKRLWQDCHQQWLDAQPSLSQGDVIDLDETWLTQASECFRVLQGFTLWQQHQEWILRCQPRFAADIQQRLTWCQGLSRQNFEAALSQQQLLRQQIGSWFEQGDCVVMPTTPSAAPLLNASAAWLANYRSELMGLTAPAGLAGLPQLHLPVLSEQDAPFGLSLLGVQHSDLSLIQAAERCCSDRQQLSQEPRHAS